MSNLLSGWRDTSSRVQLVRQIIIAPPVKKKGHRVLVALWPKKRPSGEGWPCSLMRSTSHTSSPSATKRVRC